MCAQDSTEIALESMRVAQEETRLAFVHLLLRTFEETGLHWRQLADIGIEPSTFVRATRENKEQFKEPRKATLIHWCNALYIYRGKRPEDRERFNTIMHLAGYATPEQVNTARETTEHHAACAPEKITDALGDLSQKSYQERLKKAGYGTRQFKTPELP